MPHSDVDPEAQNLVRNKTPESEFKGNSRTVVLRVVAEEDEPAVLVVEIRRLRSLGETKAAQRTAGQLVSLMETVVRTAANRFEGVRGSLEVDDLLQVGRLEAFKAIETFDPARKGSQRFEHWVFFHARRAMEDLVRTQSADVTVSNHVQRGRPTARNTGVEAPVSVLSRDWDPRQDRARRIKQSRAEDDSGSLDGLFAHLTDRDSPTPEDAYSAQEQAARLREALAKLSPEHRELIRKVHGMGRPQQSIRAIAVETGIPRSRLDVMITEAMGKLRTLLQD